MEDQALRRHVRVVRLHTNHSFFRCRDYQGGPIRHFRLSLELYRDEFARLLRKPLCKSGLHHPNPVWLGDRMFEYPIPTCDGYECWHCKAPLWDKRDPPDSLRAQSWRGILRWERRLADARRFEAEML